MNFLLITDLLTNQFSFSYSSFMLLLESGISVQDVSFMSVSNHLTFFSKAILLNDLHLHLYYPCWLPVLPNRKDRLHSWADKTLVTWIGFSRSPRIFRFIDEGRWKQPENSIVNFLGLVCWSVCAPAHACAPVNSLSIPCRIPHSLQRVLRARRPPKSQSKR